MCIKIGEQRAYNKRVCGGLYILLKKSHYSHNYNFGQDWNHPHILVWICDILSSVEYHVSYMVRYLVCCPSSDKKRFFMLASAALCRSFRLGRFSALSNSATGILGFCPIYIFWGFSGTFIKPPWILTVQTPSVKCHSQNQTQEPSPTWPMFLVSS